MTPQELKNSILQQAIQGKLVEQRPEEGTAEELFQQIQKEKQRLIAEGKIKKEKPLPDITEEEKPFEISESWKWCYIGDIFLHNTGKAQNSTGSTKGVMRKFITTSNLYWNRFDFSKVKEMPFTEQELVRCTVKKGDLLVCEGGDCGRSAIWCYDEEVCIQNHVHRLRPYVEISIEYFYYLFYIYKFTGKLNGRGVGIQGLSNEAIHKVMLPLPPFAEQKRIVAKIEELLPYIDRYEESWRKLETFNNRFPSDMKKSLLQYAIQGKLVEQRPEEGSAEELFQRIQEEKQRLIAESKIKKEKPLPEITEEEKPFEIPESWKWVRLGSIVELNPKNDIDDLLEVSFIPMAHVADGYRNEHTFEVKKWGEIKKGFTHFATGDIGIAKITPCFQNKKSVIFAGLKNGYGAGTTELSIVRVVNNSMLKEYLLWFFKSAYFIDNGVRSFTGTAGQQRIHKDYLSNCLLPLPPLAEQKRIVAKLEELLLLCENLIKPGQEKECRV